MKFTKAAAIKLATKYNLDLTVVPIDEFQFGLNVELEHGSMLRKITKLTNVTHNDPDVTCRITLSHLIENPRYYCYLKAMEAKGDKYWSTRKKPSIFLAKK